MKLLLFSALCIFSVSAFAQVPKKNNPYLFQLPDTLKKFKGNENTLRELKDYLQRKKFQNNSIASKHGNIITLPQDHMPCLVPDTNVAAKIPNAWAGIAVPYTAPYQPIPNPALPKVQSFTWNSLDSGPGLPSK